jgi:hypothetical protein
VDVVILEISCMGENLFSGGTIVYEIAKEASRYIKNFNDDATDGSIP